MSEAESLPSEPMDRLAGDKILVARDKVIDWIEADLWRRFEKRLWAIVSVFLVLVTLAGFVGIPYYISNETRKNFEKQTLRYAEEQAQFMSMSKAYFHLSAQYLAYKANFRRDIAAALADVEDFENEQNAERRFSFDSPTDLLQKLLLEQKYSKVLDANFTMQSLNNMPSDKYKTFRLSNNESIISESRSINGAAASTSPHPFRNGDLKDFYSDIKMRLVILASYEQSLAAMEEKIFRIGGRDNLSEKTRELEVKTQQDSVFLPLFDKYLSVNAKIVKLPLQDSGYVDEERARRLLAYYVTEAGIQPESMNSIDSISKLSVAAKAKP